ncbi:GNAT family N-acetyltransferase [bacterium]|nr:GNAT family N-acetyltransferase [bacterium]
MLKQTHNLELVLSTFASDPAAGFTLRNSCRWRDKDGRAAILLVDDPDKPTMLAAHNDSTFMLRAGSYADYLRLMGHLLRGEVQQDEGWPDPALAAAWKHREGRGPYLFLDSCPVDSFRAGIEAGFVPALPEDSTEPDFTGAHILYWLGRPQLSNHIKHSCRLGRGMELFELLRQGVGYDPEGGYVRACLNAGPSFVCEVNGEPVSWSCTHLNGSMGMIYTPEKHRRQGYGTSLSAFQIDHMLARDGIAQCHVVETNTASLGMLAGLGARISNDHKVLWRVLRWPS